MVATLEGKGQWDFVVFRYDRWLNADRPMH